MKPHFIPSQISYADFTDSVKDYPQRVPEKIQGLEELRYHEIPEAIAQRKKADEAFLEKTELQSLVEWKLKFGTYRPNLAKLVASNPAEEVRQTSSSAFSTFASTSPPEPGKAISTLSKLKGIGPATASLILSCYDPVTVPFFSDELFRWLHWESGLDNDSNKKRKADSDMEGWERKIKYTAKEYTSVFEKTTALRERLRKEGGEEVRAVDVERAAYDIAKRDVLLLLPSTEEDSAGDHPVEGSASPANDVSTKDKPPSQREPRSKRRKA
ncbi:MAG: hypothetical protein Q9225_007090, partial [Loekoesia sp. 1 TL-2023]